LAYSSAVEARHFLIQEGYFTSPTTLAVIENPNVKGSGSNPNYNKLTNSKSFLTASFFNLTFKYLIAGAIRFTEVKAWRRAGTVL